MSVSPHPNWSIKLRTPLGADVFETLEFKGHEAVSELYSFQLEVVSHEEIAAQISRLLGETITVEMSAEAKDPHARYFQGIASEISCLGQVNSLHRYALTMVPHVWPLTQMRRCRIFQQKSVPEILQEVFKGYTVSFDLGKGVPPRKYVQRNYTVQYHESDFAFASRLMEQEGIYFYFEHDKAASSPDSVERLMIADDSLLGPMIPEERLRYDPVGGGTRSQACVYDWRYTQRFSPTSYTLGDHDFQLSHPSLQASGTRPASVKVGRLVHDLKPSASAKIEHYAFSGEVSKQFDEVDPNGSADATRLAGLPEEEDRTSRTRSKEILVGSLSVHAASNCPSLAPGYRFELVGHSNADDTYFVTRVYHEVRQADPRSGLATACAYRNEFSGIPAAVQYVPQRATPQPIIHGTQTATVVGPQGQEIWTDKHGRVKVHFHWDRDGQRDGGDSCWLRVATAWAGNQWGKLSLPRVGQEVVVEFMDGDPDRPLITGSVYNANHGPPVPLPQRRAQSVWKSQSVGGDSTQYSGIGIDDTQGAEYLQIHSQRHLIESTEADRFVNVGGWQATNICTGSSRQVGGFTPHQSWEGPFGWNSQVDGGVALDSDLVLGFKDQSVLGMSRSYCFGWSRDIVFNPIGYLLSTNFVPPETPIPSKVLATGELIHGQVRAIEGAYTQLVAGSSLSITRGHHVSGNFELPCGFHSLEAFFEPVRFLRGGYFIDAEIEQILAFLKTQIIDAIAKKANRESYTDLSEQYFERYKALAGTASAEFTLFLWTLWEYDAATASVSTDLIRRINEKYHAFFTNANTTALTGDDDVSDSLVNTVVLSDDDESGSGGSIATASLPKSFAHSTTGVYSIRSSGIIFTSLPPSEGEDGVITIECFGSAPSGGVINIYASQTTSVFGGAQAMLKLSTLEETDGEAILSCGPTGTIKLQSGPEMEPNLLSMEPEGIAVQSLKGIELKSLPSVVQVNPTTIKLSLSPTNSITMSETEIAMTVGASKLSLTESGLTLNGSTINATAAASVSFKTSAFSIDP